jgi:FkbM family methyltransferase
MTRLDQVLQRPEFVERPPVLVDIGASGQIHHAWKRLARYSICIAFDADDRDFSTAAKRSHPYRTLHLHNNIVSDLDRKELDFYLTKSPHCSSALPPETDKLSNWIFADLFDVVRKVKLRSRTLSDILREHGLSQVDWFKTDSQGTDLRLFLSLGDEVARRVLIASFEPGLIDAYAGEDKLHTLLAKMDELPFWMHDLVIRGTQRLSRSLWETRVRPLSNGWPPLALKMSPGWAEVSFLNTLAGGERFDKRDYLLAWVIASLHDQYGFALDVAVRGAQRFDDPVFEELAEESIAATVGVADRLLPTVAKRALGVIRRLRARLA